MNTSDLNSPITWAMRVDGCQVRQVLLSDGPWFRNTQVALFGAKYWLHTDQATLRAQVRSLSQVIRTKVRALSLQHARWLLWAQWGFHSIQYGPVKVKVTK